MRELKKIIRRARYLSEFGKALLAALILIWFSVAMFPAKWIVSNTENIDDCMPVSGCATTYHHPMQLSSPAPHVEVVPPSHVKPAPRPSRFGRPDR